MRSVAQNRFLKLLPREATVVGAFALVIVAAVFSVHSAGATQAMPSANFKTLYKFSGGADGAGPDALAARTGLALSAA